MLIVALAIVGVGLAIYQSQQEATDSKLSTDLQDVESHNQSSLDVSSSSQSKSSQEDGQSETTEERQGIYAAYTPELLAKGDNVLFFKASWCPTCSALDRDIEASLDDIPAKINILKVDYDEAGDLKWKYGVTYQHTLVQVSEDGEQLKKWSGSMTLEQLLEAVI